MEDGILILFFGVASVTFLLVFILFKLVQENPGFDQTTSLKSRWKRASGGVFFALLLLLLTGIPSLRHLTVFSLGKFHLSLEILFCWLGMNTVLGSIAYAWMPLWRNWVKKEVKWNKELY